ncbi:MAG: hypothetical protein KME32_35510 [Mojavia pulchra JT2-VF2]|jgi:DNA-directed RNA polymerase subunit RPC12/RpoP|uniref:Topoisomerase 6 subunit A/Spo11 TOPRIM domain-containing protein n=1 Tax=Mojavia pulchra JT2-VF2 TaxID=287848 RepID=A0A951Q8W5_9NOST|nr:hypothetical protein [Mojavia pulchra JT2-VF2]
MKCIKCTTDNTLKDRTENHGRCKHCRHQFVFEPTSMVGVRFTDLFFAKAIADVSANSTLFYTQKQFLYLIDKRFQSKNYTSLLLLLLPLGAIIFYIHNFITFPAFFFIVIFDQMHSNKRSYTQRQKSAKSLINLGISTLLAGIVLSLIISSFKLFVGCLIIGLLAIYLGKREQAQPTNIVYKFRISDSQLQGWLASWRRVNNQSDKILPPPQEQSTPITINADVTAYSFDRLVVCDNAAVAQMLIANNFHFENNCAILTITGYPQNIFDTTMRMLHRNPDLTVYVLHDCNPNGMTLIDHLRTNPMWFQGREVTIIDVGLLPRQILAGNHSIFTQTSSESAEAAKQLSLEVRSSLSSVELEWLDSGNFVELESFTPQRLIQILNRAMISSLTLNNDDSSLFLVGDSGNSMYVVESFG